MKIAFITLGCPKNELDTELMQGLLAQKGFLLVERVEEADLLVINTCSFIEEARQEAIESILSAIEMKNEGRFNHLVVSGCLVKGYLKELKEEFSLVDAYLGTGDLDAIVDIAEALNKGETFDSKERKGWFDYNRFWPRFLTSPGITRYLRIAEGCDEHCSYCVIPSLRGPYRSRPLEDLQKEAQYLARTGTKELILIAQDTGSYGRDLSGAYGLSDLLINLSAIKGLHWIRLLYLNLKWVTSELLETIKGHDKILPYLDIPLQHSSPSILKAMGRKEDSENLFEKLCLIQEALPGVTLRTTLMVGFPGEKEKDFQDLLSFVKRGFFDHLGVFCYSREENTLAYGMKDQVPDLLKEERRKEILLLQQEISRRKNQSLVGEDLEVLVEEIDTQDPPFLVGRSRRDAPEIDNQVFFTTDSLQIHRFCTVKIIRGNEYELLGVEV